MECKQGKRKLLMHNTQRRQKQYPRKGLAGEENQAQRREGAERRLTAAYFGGLSFITTGDARATTRGARNVITMASFSGSRVTAKK